jgi:hypothetical protein
MCRRILLALAALALAAMVPAFAGQVPLGAPAGCAPVLNLQAPAPEAPVCKASLPATGPAQPEFMSTPSKVVTYRGYCQCGCSNLKNCNTNADCPGGGNCLGGITCC